MSQIHTCQNCGKQYQGYYCNWCGERLFDNKQRQISVLATNLIESLFNVDGKLLTSIRLFITKPGYLAYQHWRGVRMSYMSPVSFFLIINVIYFLFSPMTDFALPLHNQAMQPYSEWVQPTIDSYLANTEITFEKLAIQYDAISSALAKSLVILSIPFLVPFIWIVNPSRKYYLLDHCVSALYLYSFVLVWPIILGGIMSLLSWSSIDLSPFGITGLGLLLTSYYVYSFFFQVQMYQNTILLSALKSMVILIGIAVSHFIYRFIQFWLVWWQIT
ncbi:MAG: DUF3667 domain-containing protein [Paraglaciecola sp.]|uniref:DUF3667 domain-containing protein n=1 Tax=Paraglaciecola sp. TaxID=1920173 RepID=UPI0032988AEA